MNINPFLMTAVNGFCLDKCQPFKLKVVYEYDSYCLNVMFPKEINIDLNDDDYIKYISSKSKNVFLVKILVNAINQKLNESEKIDVSKIFEELTTVEDQIKNLISLHNNYGSSLSWEVVFEDEALGDEINEKLEGLF